MDAYVISIARQTLFLTLILTAAPVGLALIIGLAVSLLQATTQIQEQTLTFVPKLVVIFMVISLLGPWSISQLMAFAENLINSIPSYVK